MMMLSSTGTMLAALRDAHEITLLAYMLHPGAMEDALVAAARGGARVHVRLEGRPYADARGGLLARNRAEIAKLTAAGIDARLVDTDPRAPEPLHAKAVAADDALFLDDRNFNGDRGDTILRDTTARDVRTFRAAADGRDTAGSPWFAMHKRGALALEAKVIEAARPSSDLVVESESFGRGDAVYSALDRAALAGLSPRLLVARSELAHDAREAAALARLVHDGVRVRVCADQEKFAVAGSRAWVGSANASAAFAQPDTIDWGARTSAPPIVHRLRAAFERRWSTARTFEPPTSSRAVS